MHSVCIVMHMDTLDSHITRERTRHGLSEGQEQRVRESAARWSALYPGEELGIGVFELLCDVAKGDKADVRTVLKHAGKRVDTLVAELEIARRWLRMSTAAAVVSGMSEVDAARSTGANRRTVRAAVGKE